ncbi:addiction module protein [Rhodococcus sp. Leaf7]|uniref:Fic family protein n=1 Tax=unclassified Rhodococcus (in: high G+C Gram-positive bacteria) TaxID=192944 RepID=UPI0006FEEADC|nr:MULTISPECIES: Fic family protein [unclassified Rhodococcus (in: high G+C Gram-positive bacteria)]KQU07384.1 addiction module protein [Rhodococcus sp. Leaf7]KQU42904.1 addiction module protein [Rhodococcus sp. Leaf247]
MAAWQPDIPFNELPPPPGADELETRAVLKAAIAANTALAKLDQAVVSIPNPTVLINSIPILEAQASSEIENIVTTTDELFRHLDDDAGADPATRETLRYRTALKVGFDRTTERGLTTSTAIDVCSTIKGREMQVRTIPGTRIGNPSTGEVVYSPPEGRALIEEKLSAWERFIHDDDGMDPLVRMAVAHYQFEAIHPFADGNGRTGRILNVMLLIEAGLLRMPVLYLSRYINDTKNDYYRLLLEVTSDAAWEAWVLYVLAGVERTSNDTLHTVHAIRALQEDFSHRARAVSKGGADSEFQSVLFEQPYCRISTVVSRCGVSRPTATSWLSALVGAGMLQESKVGRDRLFINREFLRLLVRPHDRQ